MPAKNILITSLTQQLYTLHHGWLNAWLRKKLGCHDTAADLAQDTFVRLIVAGKAPSPEQSRAYLAQIAKGLVIDLYRRRHLERTYQEWLFQLPESQLPSPEHQAIVLQSLVQLDQILAELPRKVRETFLLSRFDGLTYSEIAQKLGVSVASVRVYMLKAVQACMVQQ
ncbi:sigma-70 family RNA polymerase sigma factor [Methylobacillus gramineus]|uniref:sigma-70 family RNA polymerase sigma factor n=1 Tax=Methylobacillus gramineus TaxID=755169 RepID=UPI001CFF5C67|nr:sigma-70 family RNA polymerase sigma factor [Methylobacillus gramineus]MCB5185060.1 sigma-70 family RNA polymerase sigma factor [Methylobacillus gramineus]